VIKSVDRFDFLAVPSLNKSLVLELARREFRSRKENLLLLGNWAQASVFVSLRLFHFSY
jgi:hypothetical protein